MYRLGNINYELDDLDQAIENFLQLEELDLSPKDNYNALNGLMLSSFTKGSFSETINYAAQIVDAEWKPIFAESQAKLVQAKSYLELGKVAEGQAILEQLETGDDEVAAEAAYLRANLAFEQGDHDSSLDKLFALTSKFGSYTVWVEKAYLLIAENYIAKDELFQAKATLRSIVQHSRDPHTIGVARARLDEIEGNVSVDTIKTGNE